MVGYYCYQSCSKRLVRLDIDICMVRSVKNQSEITNIAMMFKNMIEERLNKSEEELAQDHDLREEKLPEEMLS